jgi:protein SCO1/2
MASSSSIARLCSSVAFLATVACQRTPQLPTLGSVPPFTLTAQNGAAFDSRSLDGKIWVADFIFTNCTGPCPRMTSQMHSVQKNFAGNAGVKFVSFSIDPLRDTPAALTEYAAKFHADSSQWTFLTGPIPTLHNLSRNVFMLGDVDGRTFEHSTRFMLVDRKARIRGAYLTSESESIPRLLADIQTLLKDPS